MISKVVINCEMMRIKLIRMGIVGIIRKGIMELLLADFGVVTVCSGFIACLCKRMNDYISLFKIDKMLSDFYLPQKAK